MSSRLLVLAVLAILALNASLALAFSRSLRMCEIDEAGMTRGMGGTNSNLGYSIKVDNPSATGATVSITHPRNTEIRGLLLWAVDATNKRVGTWAVRQGVTAYVPNTNCEGGAIAHNAAGPKPLRAGDAASPEGFTLTIPRDVQGPVSVRAVVATGRTQWQFTPAVPLQAAGGQTTPTPARPSAATGLEVSGAMSLAAAAVAAAAVAAVVA